MERKQIEVEFTENKLPVHFVNVFSVIHGGDDYFIKLGNAMPPDLSKEEMAKLEKLEVTPIFVCALTKSSMKAFIKLLQSEYEEDEKER